MTVKTWSDPSKFMNKNKMKHTYTFLLRAAGQFAVIVAIGGCKPPAAKSVQSYEVQPGQNLAETVSPGVDYPGKIAASEVPIRGLYPRPRGTSDPFDTLEAIRSFHATRLEWIYGLTPEFVKKVTDMGVSVSGATAEGTGVYDMSQPGWLEKYSILTLDLKPTTAPWMRKWATPGPWFCVNNPAARETCLKHLKAQIDMGIRDIQRDDPAANEAALRWGACFCPACVDGFRDYLKKQNLSAEKLKELGTGNLDTFDYRQYLIAQNAPVGDGFSAYPGGDLKRMFGQFQKESTINFHKWWREEMNRYAGRYVPASANNGGKEFDGTYAPFDFWIGELSMAHASPDFLYNIAVKVRSLGKGQIFTMPLQGDPVITPEWLQTIRKALATTYATGLHMEAPWDTYLPNPEASRFFGDPKDSADLYAMARAASKYLDGYEDAAATGGVIVDPRWQKSGKPVSEFPRLSRVSAFTRAKPGDGNAPVTVHLVDWSSEPKPFHVSLRPDLFFAGRPFRVTLITPKPYDRAAHDKAFDTKDYSDLINRTELGSGRVTTFDIPALNPWGILVLEPLPADAESGSPVWAPSLSEEGLVGDGAELKLQLFSATKDAKIHYTLDGTEPGIEAAVYNGPVSLPNGENLTVRSKSFVGETASAESRIAWTASPGRIVPQLVKNADFQQGLSEWKTIIFPDVRSGSDVQASVGTLPSSPQTPAIKLYVAKSNAATAYHLRLAQNLKIPALTQATLTGTIEADRSCTVRFGLQGDEPPHEIIVLKEIALEPGRPKKVDQVALSGGADLTVLLQLDLGLCPPGTTIWLADPTVQLVQLE